MNLESNLDLDHLRSGAAGGAGVVRTAAGQRLCRTRRPAGEVSREFPRYHEKALRGPFAFHGCPMGAVWVPWSSAVGDSTELLCLGVPGS